MTSYLVSMATFGAIYAILALALNLMWGLTGMVNLGVVGFYAFGGYLSALATVELGLLKRALGDAFNVSYLGFTLLMLVVAMVLVERIRTAPFGRALRAIREDAQVAAFAGKDVFALKVQAFAIGGGIAGLAGALYAHYTSYIVPEIYVPLLTIYIFLALTAGGLANTWGATLGAFAIVFCLESTRFLIGVIPSIGAERLAALREFLVGLCLLLVLLYRPRGLLPERLPRLGASRQG